MISSASKIKRRKMVETQLLKRGIRNPKVLQAFLDVPRELFVKPQDFFEAYDDCPLPIDFGQTISQPYMVALMTELVYKSPPAKMLDVGTGSGYQTAILAYLGFEVLSIERIPELAKLAEAKISSQSYSSRVKIIVGDGSAGYPAGAPYDGIIVSGASPEIPQELLRELKPEGKMVIPCGTLGIQKLLLLAKDKNGKITRTESIDCRFVPLIGKNAFKDVK